MYQCEICDFSEQAQDTEMDWCVYRTDGHYINQRLKRQKDPNGLAIEFDTDIVEDPTLRRHPEMSCQAVGCENDPPVSFLHSDENSAFRVYVCPKCRGYWKLDKGSEPSDQQLLLKHKHLVDHVTKTDQEAEMEKYLFEGRGHKDPLDEYEMVDRGNS